MSPLGIRITARFRPSILSFILRNVEHDILTEPSSSLGLYEGGKTTFNYTDDIRGEDRVTNKSVLGASTYPTRLSLPQQSDPDLGL